MHGPEEFGGISASALLEDHAFEREMNDQETRTGNGFDVEKIGEIVDDDAIAGFVRGDDFSKRDDTNERRKRADG
jgi:hypothetical protein